MSPAPSIGLDYSHVMGGLSFVNIGPTVHKLKDKGAYLGLSKNPAFFGLHSATFKGLPNSPLPPSTRRKLEEFNDLSQSKM